MHQIDNDTAVSVMPTIGDVGPNPNGYFTHANPAAQIAPTRLDADWLNALMLEILGVLDGAAIAPDKTKRDQLYSAIYKLIYGTLPTGGTSDPLNSPLSANEALLGIIGGPDLTITANAGANDLNLTASNVRINSDFKLADKSSISQISNATFTDSDSIIPTQAAIKSYIDAYDLSTLPWYIPDSTHTSYVTGPIAINSGNVDIGYIIGLPVKHPSAATLKQVRIAWAKIIVIGGVNTTTNLTATFTILKNGSPTSMSTTVTGMTSPWSTSILTGSVTLAANDTFALRVNVSSASTTRLERLGWSCVLEAI